MFELKLYLKLTLACMLAGVLSGCVTYGAIVNENKKRLVSTNSGNHTVLVVAAKDYASVPSCSNFNNQNIGVGGMTVPFYYVGNGIDAAVATSDAIKKCSRDNVSCLPFAHINKENAFCLSDDIRANYNRAQIAEAAAKKEELEYNARNSRRNECLNMGFSDGSDTLASCILSLKNLESQAIYHANQSRQEAARLAKIKRDQDIERNLSLMQLGLGMAAGGRYGASTVRVGPLPTLPPPPPPITIVAPSGNRYSCSTFGTTVTCR
jgi:hypothetical protein